ncbi:hypothetical protein SAMN02745111_01536 [Eubacterium uniforme]|uniref:Fibronectin type-III domain-containing protein n=1 Tax=Eubacterium uniforme TaxID=39495 RepID=A0A1T4VUE3_9FIRM|nr:clostripain-related cysteine peptidase [Eubacterium uniforme]SKA68121.1 hypothetical protein SAMN02745111_01536 [Eubacterium uniforme]
MYNFKKRLVSLTSAAMLVMTGFNVLGMQVTSYAEEAKKPIVSQKAKGWTFGIYLCGQNLEAINSNSTADLMEILKADVPEGFSKDNNIIVETGGCLAWHFKEEYSKYLMEEKGLSEAEVDQVIPEEIDSKKLSQYKINFEHEYTTDEESTQTIPTLEFIKDIADYDPAMLEDFADEDLDDELDSNTAGKEGDTVVGDKEDDTVKYANMGDEYFLNAFLEDLDKEFPAEHMALDLWNHGGGITGGVCYDEYTDDPITLLELKKVLKNRVDNGYDKLDIIGYDACLMSSYESWVGLSAYAKIGVGSLTSEPGDGWYYTPFIEDLGANYTKEDYTPAKFAASIVDAYGEYYKFDGVLMQQTWDEYLEEQEENEGEDIDIKAIFNNARKNAVVKEESAVSGNKEDVNEDVKEETETSRPYDEEFLEGAEIALAPAMLTSVDLEKVALSAVKFNSFGEDLFKAYADNEGVTSIFEKATEDGVIEFGAEIVDVTKLFEAVETVAPERIENLKDSSNPYHEIAATSYQNLLDNMDELKESISAGLINSYNGWESNTFYNTLAMSIFVPDQMADNDIAIFNANEYPLVSVSSAYARLAYLYASNIKMEDIKNIPCNPQYGYDVASGVFNVNVTEEEAMTINSLDSFTYVNYSGKNYLLNTHSVYPGEDMILAMLYGDVDNLDDIRYETSLEIKPIDKYYSIGDKTPINAEIIDETYDEKDPYSGEFHYLYILGMLNGKEGEFYFQKDDNGKYVFDRFYEYSFGELEEESQEEKTKRIKSVIRNIKDEDVDLIPIEEDDGVTELKVGDVINLEIREAKEAKFMTWGTGEVKENITYTMSKDYTISEADLKEGVYTDYDEENNASKVNYKKYSPTFGENAISADDVNIALGYSRYIGYDEETDEELYQADGRVYNVGRIKSFATGKIKVEKEEFELTGEAITPKVTFEGNKFVEGKDFEVTYENNIGIGKAKAIVKPLGDLEIVGERTVEFNIVKAKVTVAGKEKTVYVTVYVKQPKQVKVKSVKNNKKKAFTIKWKKVKGASGYVVKYARNKKFTKGKKVRMIKNIKKTSLTLKKLKKNKNYFVKVRAYTLDKNGKKVYGNWSEVKKIKIKK